MNLNKIQLYVIIGLLLVMMGSLAYRSWKTQEAIEKQAEVFSEAIKRTTEAMGNVTALSTKIMDDNKKAIDELSKIEKRTSAALDQAREDQVKEQERLRMEFATKAAAISGVFKKQYEDSLLENPEDVYENFSNALSLWADLWADKPVSPGN